MLCIEKQTIISYIFSYTLLYIMLCIVEVFVPMSQASHMDSVSRPAAKAALEVLIEGLSIFSCKA